jgi:hypothetical protein
MQEISMRCTSILAAIWLCAGAVSAEDAKPVGVTSDEAKDGFVSLFDGKTLNGWQGDVKHYEVKDGVMTCKGGLLFTAKQYANFILRFEFKLQPAGNNGVGIRCPLKGAPHLDGMEIQILDDGHEKYKGWLQPYQTHGSVYGVVAAKRGFLKPVGQWNQEEIMADGPHIKITLNGHVIVDADLSKIEKTPDHLAHPGIKAKKGYIAWLGHGEPPDPVGFRNVRIKELP